METKVETELRNQKLRNGMLQGKLDKVSKALVSKELEQKFLLNSYRTLRTTLSQAYTTRNPEEKLRILNHSINHINKILSMKECNRDSQYFRLAQVRVKRIIGDIQ